MLTASYLSGNTPTDTAVILLIQQIQKDILAKLLPANADVVAWMTSEILNNTHDPEVAWKAISLWIFQNRDNPEFNIINPDQLEDVRNRVMNVLAPSPPPPPAGTPPAGTPPAGTPPAGTPPAGTPPAGTPPAGTPPAGTPPAPPQETTSWIWPIGLAAVGIGLFLFLRRNN